MPQLRASVAQLQAVITAEKAAWRGEGCGGCAGGRSGCQRVTHVESSGGDVAGSNIDKRQIINLFPAGAAQRSLRAAPRRRAAVLAAPALLPQILAGEEWVKEQLKW